MQHGTTREETLQEALSAVEEGRDDTRMRAEWTRRLDELVPWPHASELEELGFLQLCQHLHEQTTSTAERLDLHDALNAAWVWARGGSVRLHVESCLESVTDNLCEELFEQLTRSTAAADAMRAYRTLRRVYGQDEWLLEVASAHPLIPGTQIARDCPAAVGWAAPPTLLRKLEAEGADETLDRILGHSEETAPERVHQLRDPQGYLHLALERHLAAGEAIPAWLWHTGIMEERFDDVLRRIPWREVEIAAGAGVRKLLREHLEYELGDDPERRETFAVLAAGFAGTLAELLDAARLL